MDSGFPQGQGSEMSTEATPRLVYSSNFRFRVITEAVVAVKGIGYHLL